MKTLLKNRKAKFNYEIQKKYTAGIMLTGSEVKSLREGKGNVGDAYCYFKEDGLYIKSLYIPEYKPAGKKNHEPYRERKLLLKKSELKALKEKSEQKGWSIVPTVFLESDSRKIKVEIGLGKGRNTVNKKDYIKEKDAKRDTDRAIKELGR